MTERKCKKKVTNSVPRDFVYQAKYDIYGNVDVFFRKTFLEKYCGIMEKSRIFVMKCICNRTNRLFRFG
jgi:hypothetical protein